MISLIILGIGLFIGTHVDDLLLLLGLFAGRRIATVTIVLGQYLGVAVLLFGSLLCAQIAVILPPASLRLFGCVPLLLGLYKLAERILHPSAQETEQPAAESHARHLLGVTALTIAGGGDNIGIYLPLFATRPTSERLSIIFIFLAMTGPWCLLADWLANHRRLRAPIARWGEWLFPLVLIGLGLRILFPGH